MAVNGIAFHVCFQLTEESEAVQPGSGQSRVVYALAVPFRAGIYPPYGFVCGFGEVI